jgi:pimeloyl-ACP methyl ester carboxylesterase
LVEAPDWFRRALAHKPDEARVEVLGCPIHYLRWGDPEKPGIVLVHGGAAHAHWWSFIAPLLTSSYHVVALDLSGHGDSGRRTAYRSEDWGEEVMAVARDAGIVGAPLLVGHSMGGIVCISAAARWGDRLAGAIIVDSPVRRPDPESEEGTRGRAFRNPKTYPTFELAVAKFRLVPPQPCDNAFILDHVARHSLHQTAEGWTWKFDPVVFRRATSDSIAQHLAQVRCRVALFRGELSELVTPDVADYMVELLDRNAPLVEIPQAHHHLLLDQPLAFVSALRAILADWEHTLPRLSRDRRG